MGSFSIATDITVTNPNSKAMDITVTNPNTLATDITVTNLNTEDLNLSDAYPYKTRREAQLSLTSVSGVTAPSSWTKFAEFTTADLQILGATANTSTDTIDLIEGYLAKVTLTIDTGAFDPFDGSITFRVKAGSTVVGTSSPKSQNQTSVTTFEDIDISTDTDLTVEWQYSDPVDCDFDSITFNAIVTVV